MKVRELIELLERQDPDAEVTQRNWPMQYSVAGIASRGDILDAEVDLPAPRRYVDGAAANDVILVEGSGSATA